MYCRKCGAWLEEGSYYCSNCGAEQEVSPPSAPLRCAWPEWEMEQPPIGRGSFGTVYRAVRRDYDMESCAAIKVISIPGDPAEVDSLRVDGMGEDAARTYLKGVVRDFIGEIRLMESLKGAPNIVGVEDYKVIEKQGQIGWDIYIRMELLTPFGQYISGRTLTEAEIIRLGVDICTALELCSRRNIIHRDIKPENIFIDRFGQFKLGDFGIARKLENMSGGLSQKGTFNYMAPEVASGRAYDTRVDIYSLGIVLYRLLNGNRLPFLFTDRQLLDPNDRRMALERRLSGQPLPIPCDASPAMAEVILRACAHNPNDRFASALEMKQALLRVAGGERVLSCAPVDDRTIRVLHPKRDGEKPAGGGRYPPSRAPQEETVDVFQAFADGRSDTTGIHADPRSDTATVSSQSAPQEEQKTAFCARCGTQMPTKLRFCPRCGLEQPTPAPKPEPPQKQTASGGKNRWWLIAVCAVVAMAVIVAAALLLSNRMHRADNEYLLVKRSYYSSDDWVYWLDYTYDKNGNLLTQTNYDADGSIEWWGEYTYDKNGNMLTETYYDADGSIEGWFEYTYGDNGNLLTQTDYDAAGGITGWIESTYDNNGNEIKWVAFDADGSIACWYEYTYDENGNCVEERGYNENGALFGRTEYEYMTLAEWNASEKTSRPAPKAGGTNGG